MLYNNSKSSPRSPRMSGTNYQNVGGRLLNENICYRDNPCRGTHGVHIIRRHSQAPWHLVLLNVVELQ